MEQLFELKIEDIGDQIKATIHAEIKTPFDIEIISEVFTSSFINFVIVETLEECEDKEIQKYKFLEYMSKSYDEDLKNFKNTIIKRTNERNNNTTII